MSQKPKNNNRAQRMLYGSGLREVGPDVADTLSDTAVRKIGLTRYARRAAMKTGVFAVGTTLALTMGQPFVKAQNRQGIELERKHNETHADRHEQEAEERVEDIGAFVATNPGASEEEIGNLEVSSGSKN